MEKIFVGNKFIKELTKYLKTENISYEIKRDSVFVSKELKNQVEGQLNKIIFKIDPNELFSRQSGFEE